MARGRAQSVALMAMRPEFAERIFSGEKRVEFRTARFAGRVTHILIYATAPIKKVVGYFEVEGIDKAASFEDLWKRYKDVAGVEQSYLRSYLGERNRGVAIRVGDVFRFVEPRALESVNRALRPPQSFVYVEPDLFGEFVNRPIVCAEEPTGSKGTARGAVSEV